ncbi:MAG: hypothetical protein KC486_35925 [Myxococcales bacterium]|nr:hypothetical protein [Myxococcales bacterium]
MDEPRDDIDDLLASYRRAIEPSAESEARVRDALRTAIPSWSTPPAAADRGALVALVGCGRGRHLLAVGCALAAALILAFGVTSLLGERRDGGRDLAQTPFQRSDAGAEERRVDVRTPRGSAPSGAAREAEDAGNDDLADDEVTAEGAVDAAKADESVGTERTETTERREGTPNTEAEAPRRARAAARRAAPEPDVEPEPEAQEAAPALDLARELRLIREAEAHLRAGRHAEALAAIERHARDFPRGQLEPEREASRVTALCLRGSDGEAQARAKTFAERWPASPLLARVRRVCDEVAAD